MAKELHTEEFNYHLPEELIASKPIERRDDSRMMVIDRKTGKISCQLFEDFKTFIREGDICVLNDTKVIPSRFSTDEGNIEIIRLEEPEPRLWKCLVRDFSDGKFVVSCVVCKPPQLPLSQDHTYC